jgi:hypothetical protein
MTRPRRPRGGVRGMSQALWLDFVDEPIPDELWGELFFIREEERLEQWRLLRDQIIEAWARERPGTRPSHWWRYTAPKEPVPVYGGHRLEAAHRRRLGGVGMPKFEAFNHTPSFEFGVPIGWVNRFEVRYYNGREQRDVHGELLKPQFKEGDFAGIAPDPAHPPTYESEAAYLKRHNLLLPGEPKRLRKQDFEPEVLEVYVFGEDENPYRPRPGATGIGV